MVSVHAAYVHAETNSLPEVGIRPWRFYYYYFRFVGLLPSEVWSIDVCARRRTLQQQLNVCFVRQSRTDRQTWYTECFWMRRTAEWSLLINSIDFNFTLSFLVKCPRVPKSGCVCAAEFWNGIDSIESPWHTTNKVYTYIHSLHSVRIEK